jgi:ankyrin repeat protein
MTPLHIAARSGHIDAVRILLKGGASKEARDSDNNTPLMLADKNRYADTVELLLEHGATID